MSVLWCELALSRNRATPSTVATVGTAEWDKLLPAKAQAPVSAVHRQKTWMSTRSTNMCYLARHEIGTDVPDGELAGDRQNADETSTRAVIFKPDAPGSRRKQRVVLGEPYVEAGSKTTTTLPYENCPTLDDVSVKPLDAQTLGLAVHARF